MFHNCVQLIEGCIIVCVLFLEAYIAVYVLFLEGYITMWDVGDFLENPESESKVSWDFFSSQPVLILDRHF